MKFVLLIHGDLKAWAEMSEDEARRHRAGHVAFREAVGAGVLDTLEFAPVASAVTIESGQDPSVRAGQYHDSDRGLGGFYLIDVADRDEAVRLASLLPELRGGYAAGVEIREVPT